MRVRQVTLECCGTPFAYGHHFGAVRPDRGIKVSTSNVYEKHRRICLGEVEKDDASSNVNVDVNVEIVRERYHGSFMT